MKAVYILIILTCAGCVSADKDFRTTNINKTTIDWNYKNTTTFSTVDYELMLTINNANTNIIKDMYYRYAVDSDTSGINYIMNNYYIGLLKISNRTKKPLIIESKKIHLTENNKKISMLTIEDLPKNIEKINPKGITKNIYNALWWTVLIAVSLEGDLIGRIVLGLDKLINGKEKSYFSKMKHVANFEYEDLILSTNHIDPYATKIGIVFLSKNEDIHVDRIEFFYNLEK